MAVAALILGPHLPEPFHVVDGGGVIFFGLAVYAACLCFVILMLTPAVRVRDAFESKYRVLFLGNVAVVILYCVFVSCVLFALSRATDL
jgi:hypothetical protein